jgi:hypothetical protein
MVSLNFLATLPSLLVYLVFILQDAPSTRGGLAIGETAWQY